jgi:hypothetical protein
MEFVLNALVIVVQLALAGFVVWGGWLCLREWLPARRAQPQSFERVASLVLLALLCTTIVGLG